MKTVVGIGANVCDTLISVSHYPTEDTKMCADGIIRCGGGPVATGLAAASKFGAECKYIGTLTDDPAGIFLLSDLEKYGISTEYTTVESGYDSFSSYIILARDNATRTCVFERGNVPPTRLTDKQRTAIENADILMVDGNDLDAAIAGAMYANSCGTKVLYDAGGIYKGIGELLPLVDYLIPSEEFALGYTGLSDAESAAKKLYSEFSPEFVIVTQGKKGGIIYNGTTREYPAFKVEAVDTNGAGDVFHGAFAFALTRGLSLFDAAVFSSAVSALKCTGQGARDAVPSYDEAIKFLKENGYEL